MGKNSLVMGVIALVVLIVGAYGAYRVYKHFNRPAAVAPISETSTPAAEPSTSEGSSSASSSENIVSVTAQGFDPTTITIKAGQAVTWVNNDSAAHQVNSDPHPTHQLYPILNTIGRLNPGDKKSATFDKAGTYTYHDHLNPSFKGTIIVQ